MRQSKTATARLIQRARGFRYSLVWEGIAVGAAAGLVTVLFRLLLSQGDALRQALGELLTGRPWLLPLWLVALLVLAALVTLLLRWEPLISGSGIPQVEGELQGHLSQTWWRVLLAKFVGGLLTIGAGLSLGREGPSIQLGAMAGKGVSRLCRRDMTEERMLLTCGASAGLSAAFNAPLAGVLLVVYPAVLGGGHNLVEAVSQDQALQGLLVLFAVKFLFSMASFGAGVPGGIFLPLLVLGAVVGSSFSQGAHLLGLDTATGNFVILGMAGLFAAIVRAPVTGIVLISEMTGSFSHLLTLSLVSLAAYVVADLLHAPPVYDMLLARLLKKGKASPAPSGEKLLLESPVSVGAPACGKAIQELAWPGRSLVVSIKRHGEELLPHGGTVLEAGDVVVLLCDQQELPQVHAALEHQCKGN